MQLLSLILILILLLNLLVSIDLVYTGICDLVLDLVQKENNCSLRFIRIVVETARNFLHCIYISRSC